MIFFVIKAGTKNDFDKLWIEDATLTIEYKPKADVADTIKDVSQEDFLFIVYGTSSDSNSFEDKLLSFALEKRVLDNVIPLNISKQGGVLLKTNNPINFDAKNLKPEQLKTLVKNVKDFYSFPKSNETLSDKRIYTSLHGPLFYKASKSEATTLLNESLVQVKTKNGEDITNIYYEQ